MLRQIRSAANRVKFAIQRARRGYSDEDCWSIDLWFYDVAVPMLKQLYLTTDGIPDKYMSDAVGNPIDEEQAMLEWKKTLKQMIYLFQESDERISRRKNPYQDEYDQMMKRVRVKMGPVTRFEIKSEDDLQLKNDYLVEQSQIDKYRNHCKNEAFKLFSEHFHNLWD